jgi:nucleoside-diphosphate-sugar epimerase
MSNTILLSGASGFVGKNLLQYFLHLAPQVHFFQIQRDKEAKDENSLTWDEIGNTILTELNAFIHLAGKAHDVKSVSEPSAYFDINTKLSLKLFEAFLRSSAGQFIFISSVKAVADEVEGILTEDVFANPITAYGQSKLLAEQEMKQALETWREVHPTGKKKLIILRPCMIHGPGNKGNLNLLYQLVQKGIPWPLAVFENKRSFLSIENLCFVIHQFLTRDLSEGVYHIADDDPLSTNELIKLIGEASNKKIKLMRIPKSYIIGLAKLGDKLKLPLNSERLQKLTENYEVSNAKLVKEIGSPLPVKSKQGLLKTLKSFNK